MSDEPLFLEECEKLNAVPWKECTRFNRFVLLQKKRKNTKKPEFTATLPVDFVNRRDLVKDLIADRAKARLRDLREKFPVVVREGFPGRPPRGKLIVAGLGEMKLDGSALAREDRIRGMRNLYPQAIRETPALARFSGKPGLFMDLDLLLAPILRAVRDYADIATAASSKAVWAIGVDYSQCWESRGYLRGRLVRSLPLTPGEQLEITIKTWDRRTERKNVVESVARNLSTEITGEEKWILATKMHFSDQINASVNPSAGVNGKVGIPVDVVKVDLGGNLGVSGNFGNQLTQSTENTTEFIHSSILKSAQSLQSTRTNSVELSHESGEEVTRRQVIANTNRCHTLTYHYFEIMERFTVETRFDSAALHLLIPLRVPEITPEWVLCHECYLRKILPCETMYAGFAAAKTLLAWAKLERMYPPATTPPPGAGGGKSPHGPEAASPYADAVRLVLERWQILKTARLFSMGAGSGGDDILAGLAGGAQAIADGLGQFTSDVANGMGAAIETAGEKIEEGLEAVGEVLSGIAAGAEDVFEGIFGPMFMSQPQMIAFSAGGPQGGAGTWLYFKVAEIAAPQIAEAMTFLETSWPRTQAVSAAERPLAEYNVLTVFFAKLGMPSATFGKVDALFVGAAGAAVAAGGIGGGIIGAVGGGVAGAAIAVWGFGVSAIPGAAIGATLGGASGAAIGAGAVASVLAILATIEAAGFADTVPDDVGLKEATTHLKSLLDSVTAMAPVTGMPGMTDAADQTATEQWRGQMEQLAEAQVEYERLACHLRRNLVSYMQGIWSAMPDHDILTEVRRHGIPEEVVAARFTGFHGHYGALPVIDLDWVEKEGGLDWRKVAEELAKDASGRGRAEDITLPTPGMTVEPALGQCDACEPFIRDHRLLDLENRRAEVDVQIAHARQENLEADRFEARLAANQLDDPTPYEGASTSVEVTQP